MLVKDASLRGYSVFHVEELIVHPFYNIIPGLNNIALLRLHESVYLRGKIILSLILLKVFVKYLNKFSNIYFRYK